jgi:multiple sugar transport system ATP-binding protein
MASLSIRNVRKVYPNGAEILKGINLDIEDGQFLILVGGSGCGKSTLLNMIAGLENVSEGGIYIGNRCVNDIPPKSRDIAMVFQSYALYPTMTVRENISFGLGLARCCRRTKKDRRQGRRNLADHAFTGSQARTLIRRAKAKGRNGAGYSPQSIAVLI